MEELRQLKEAQWVHRLAHLLRRVGKSEAVASDEPKGALWKVSVASALRQTTASTNRWLTNMLALGAPNSISHSLSLVKRDCLRIQILGT